MNDTSPPAGSQTEASANSLDQAAQAFDRAWGSSPTRAPDGKFAKAEAEAPKPEAEAPKPEAPKPEAEEQPPEGQPNAAVEGEELFEIDLDDAGTRVQLTAAQLRDAVKAARTPPPAPNVEEHIAPLRQQIEQERAQLQAERQHYARQMQQFVPQVQAQLQAEFADVKSMADLQKMAAEDPARYVRFQALNEAANMAQRQMEALAAQQAQEQRQMLDKYADKQRELLAKAVPEFADPAKASAEKQALRGFLNKQGFTDDELANLVDHRTVIVARKAMLYDQLMAARPEAKKVTPMVRTIRPGTAKASTSAVRTEQRMMALDNLKRTQSIEALAQVFGSMGGTKR